MKKVLITGKSSFVGNNIKKWLSQYNGEYLVETLSLRDTKWINKDFSQYSVIVNVAGIAHIREKKENEKLYYKVNRDLAYEVARKAKLEGIKQYIFISSMSVYGIKKGVINDQTPIKPMSNYGKSKLEAENLLRSLEDDYFKVAIVRPPMIYGEGCKGNYSKLAKLAVKSPIFPNIKNKRSMIYIGNLCEFIRLIIDNTGRGYFHPQNKEYVCTSEMVRIIAKANKEKVKSIGLFNPLLKLVRIPTVNKVFGSLFYDKQIDKTNYEYNIYSFEESIYLTEKR